MTTVYLWQEDGKAAIRAQGWMGDKFASFRSSIEGARFDFQTKKNFAAFDKVPTILKRLREAGFDVSIDDELARTLEAHTAQQILDLQGAKERADYVDQALKLKGKALYPFQRYGVEWLSLRFGAVLADDMGLGKTVQALAALPAKARALVICPAVAKGVWAREVQAWREGLRVSVLSGRESFRWPTEGEMVVTNYDILTEAHKETCTPKKRKETHCKGCAPWLKDCPDQMVLVCDEAHTLKSGQTQRTDRVRAISEAVRGKGGRTWLLTATPLLNRPAELWNVFQAAGIAGEAFGTWKDFVNIFGGKQTKFGMVWKGTPGPEAAERIKRVCLRRVKTEVLPDLPAKSWNMIPVDVDKKTLRECDRILEQFGGGDDIADALKQSKIKFEDLASVRSTLAMAKIPAMLAKVEEFEEAGEPLVVFSAHRAPIDLLGERDGWAVITGDTSSEERSQIEAAFQRGDLKGIGATIKAGGVAITLTHASNELFVDREWTPALNSQAEDRIYRIGQDRPVMIHVLVATHKLDSRLEDILGVKGALITRSVEAARTTESKEIVLEEPEDFSALVKAAYDEARAPVARKPRFSGTDMGLGQSMLLKAEGLNPAQTEWAARGLRALDDMNPDGAQKENGVGPNKLDTPLVRSLRAELDAEQGLTVKQWELAIRILAKYKRQIGACP